MIQDLFHAIVKRHKRIPKPTAQSKGWRRLLWAFAGSALLHLLGLLLYFQLFQSSQAVQYIRTVLITTQPTVEQFVPQRGLGIPQNALTRTQDATIQMPSAASETGELPQVAATETLLPEDRLAAPVAVPGRKDWLEQSDKVAVQLDTLDRYRGVGPVDWVEAHAIGKHRTAVIVDPNTGHLKQAYLHVPSYLGRQGNTLANALDMVERGLQLSRRAPFEITVHYYPLGLPSSRWIPTEKEPVPDPAHRFPLYYRREKLAYQEMIEYPLIEMKNIDPQSTEVMVRYLLNGGFALNGAVGSLSQVLHERVGDAAQIEQIGLDHALFSSFYTIEKYKEPNIVCPGIYPLTGLTLEGRLVAVAGLPNFNPDHPCKSNELYVNALVYGLVQSILDRGMLAGD